MESICKGSETEDAGEGSGETADGEGAAAGVIVEVSGEKVVSECLAAGITAVGSDEEAICEESGVFLVSEPDFSVEIDNEGSAALPG